MVNAPIRLLMLEDQPADAELVRRSLERAGLAITVEHVTDEAGFQHALDTFAPQVVLADYHLPGFDGMHALEMVRRLSPQVPFIFVSGTLGEERAVATLRAGATDYILKDNLARLPAAVERAIAEAAEHAERERLAADLQTTRDRLQGLFDNALDAIFLADDDAHLIDANPAAEALTGYTRDELLRMSRPDLAADEEGSGPDRFGALLRAGQGAGQYTVRRSDGRLVEVEFRAVANIVPGVHLSILRDVTERNRAEQALRASEARFRSLTEHAADAILLIGRDRTLAWVSPAVESLFGYTADEVIGRPGLRFVHPDDTDRVNDLWQQVQRHPGRPLRPEPFRVRDSEGGWHWIEETVTNLFDDDAVGAAVVNLRDVTARHLAQEALRASEERFRQLAHNAQDVVYRLRVRPHVGFEYINPAVSRMTGHTPEEVYADPALLLHQVLHPDDRDTFAQISTGVRDVMAPLQVRWRAPDGNGWIWVEERHSVIRDEDGNVAAVEGIVRDVTAMVRSEQALRDALAREREAADRLRKLDEMKDTFLTAVSHELRTPLTALQGFAKLLVARHRELPSERLQQLLERLDHNAIRLSVLLTDLLDVSRLTRGGALEPDLTTVEVDRLVFGVIDELDLRGHHVTSDVEPLTVLMDRPKFERIVHNLLANAVRHTPRGTPIWVGLHPDGHGIHLTVEDAGPGVPDDLKLVLFEPFQVGDTPAAKTGGAGVGLSIVERFTELHGGRVWVEDRPGGGASFHVWIPHPARTGGQELVGDGVASR